MLPALLPDDARRCRVDDAMVTLFKLASVASAIVALPMIAAVDWWDALPPLISSVVAAGGVWLTYRQRSNDTKIEEQKQKNAELHDLVDQLQEQSAALLEQETVDHTELRKLRADFSRLWTLMLNYRSGIFTLVQQLRTNGIEPDWTPAPLEGMSTADDDG